MGAAREKITESNRNQEYPLPLPNLKSKQNVKEILTDKIDTYLRNSTAGYMPTHIPHLSATICMANTYILTRGDSMIATGF